MKLVEQQVDDEFAQALDQIEMTQPQLLANALGDNGVIDGVGNVVMLGSGVGNTKGEIELDRLLPGLLAFVHADPGLDPQLLDEDEIHAGSRLESVRFYPVRGRWPEPQMLVVPSP